MFNEGRYVILRLGPGVESQGPENAGGYLDEFS